MTKIRSLVPLYLCCLLVLIFKCVNCAFLKDHPRHLDDLKSLPTTKAPRSKSVNFRSSLSFLTSHFYRNNKLAEGKFLHNCTTKDSCTLIYSRLGSRLNNQNHGYFRNAAIALSLHELVEDNLQNYLQLTSTLILEINNMDVERLMINFSAMLLGPDVRGILDTFKQCTGQELKYVILPQNTPITLVHTFRINGVSIIVPKAKLNYADLASLETFNTTGFVLVDLGTKAEAALRHLRRLFDEASIEKLQFSQCIDANYLKRPLNSFETKIKEIRDRYANFPFLVMKFYVNKSNVFLDTINCIANLYKHHEMPPIIRNNPSDAMSRFKFVVEYLGEEYFSYGALLQNWYTHFMSEVAPDGKFKLFASSPRDPNVFFPDQNVKSSGFYLDGDRFDYIRIVGKLVAKSIIDDIKLKFHLPRYLLKLILDKPVQIHDLEEIDPELHETLCLIHDVDLADGSLGELYFETKVVVDGMRIKRELFTNGSTVKVEESNKSAYIKILLEYKMNNIASKEFVAGFHSVLPLNYIKEWTTAELDTLISGTMPLDNLNHSIPEVSVPIVEDSMSEKSSLFWDIFEMLNS